jgi:hypothetical protein
MEPGERKWPAQGPTADGWVRGSSGSVRANRFSPLRRKGFLILYIQFPINTKVKENWRKCLEASEKYGIFSRGSSGHLGQFWLLTP